jgi:hypothetical protein
VILCQCIGCSNPADRNVGGRMVCNPCYLKEGHLYFPHKNPFPTLRVLVTIIIVLIWLVMDVSLGTRNIVDLIVVAFSAAVMANIGWEIGRLSRR